MRFTDTEQFKDSTGYGCKTGKFHNCIFCESKEPVGVVNGTQGVYMWLCRTCGLEISRHSILPEDLKAKQEAQEERVIAFAQWCEANAKAV